MIKFELSRLEESDYPNTYKVGDLYLHTDVGIDGHYSTGYKLTGEYSGNFLEVSLKSDMIIKKSLVHYDRLFGDYNTIATNVYRKDLEPLDHLVVGVTKEGFFETFNKNIPNELISREDAIDQLNYVIRKNIETLSKVCDYVLVSGGLDSGLISFNADDFGLTRVSTDQTESIRPDTIDDNDIYRSLPYVTTDYKNTMYGFGGDYVLGRLPVFVKNLINGGIVEVDETLAYNKSYNKQTQHESSMVYNTPSSIYGNLIDCYSYGIERLEYDGRNLYTPYVDEEIIKIVCSVNNKDFIDLFINADYQKEQLKYFMDTDIFK